jgi:hypothetical protein
LEKLFGAGTFGGFINHMAHYQAILPIFSSRLNLLFIVRIIALHSWDVGL